MEKKKRTTNLRTRQHLTPMRSSETLGLSAYGETVKKNKKHTHWTGEWWKHSDFDGLL